MNWLAVASRDLSIKIYCSPVWFSRWLVWSFTLRVLRCIAGRFWFILPWLFCDMKSAISSWFPHYHLSPYKFAWVLRFIYDVFDSFNCSIFRGIEFFRRIFNFSLNFFLVFQAKSMQIFLIKTIFSIVTICFISITLNMQLISIFLLILLLHLITSAI
jgi:hypothetical protein